MVFEELFLKSGGQPILYNGLEIIAIDRIPLSSIKIHLKLSFQSIDSEWKQGVILQTKGKFKFSEQDIANKTILWERTAPKQVELLIESKDKILII